MQAMELNLDVDLDINNYSLEELLSLFQISSRGKREITEEHMKKAKSIVLRTHPDKSGLDSRFFLFYSSAYKLLYSIWKTMSINDSSTIYDANYLQESEKSLDGFLSKKTPEEFNEWFNKTFETVNGKNMSLRDGYGEWLGSEEDLEKGSHNTIMLEEKKKELRNKYALTTINKMYSNDGGAEQLVDSQEEYYSSGLFSSLPYDDLKKAHTETVIPITDEDYQNVRKFKNVSEYMKYRDESFRYNTDNKEEQPEQNPVIYETRKKEEDEELERTFGLTNEMENYIKKYTKKY
jgi:hypothetical protein